MLQEEPSVRQVERAPFGRTERGIGGIAQPEVHERGFPGLLRQFQRPPVLGRALLHRHHAFARGACHGACELTEAGAQVHAITVYHRAAPRFDATELALLNTVLAQPERFVWLFSSAEAVGHLHGMDVTGQRAIATHSRIADAARAAGFSPVVLARPDPEAVTQALKGL